MKLLIMSVKLFLYGYYCDLCMNICTAYTEYLLKKGGKLRKKPLVLLGRLSERNIKKWQRTEQKFISLSLYKKAL